MACGTATRHLYHRGVSYESISYFRLGACPAGGGAGGRRHVPLPPHTALLPAALLSGGGPHRPSGAGRSHRSHGTPGDSRAEWGHRPHWPLGRDRRDRSYRPCWHDRPHRPRWRNRPYRPRWRDRSHRPCRCNRSYRSRRCDRSYQPRWRDRSHRPRWRDCSVNICTTRKLP